MDGVRKERYDTHRTDDISDMGDTSTTGSTKVKDLLAWLDENTVETAKDTCSELASEGVPYTILDFRPVDSTVDRYPFLAVDSFSGDKVFGDQQALLALSDEDTRVSVRLEDYIRAAPGTTPSPATAAPATSRSTASTAAHHRCTALRDSSTASSAYNVDWSAKDSEL